MLKLLENGEFNHLTIILTPYFETWTNHETMNILYYK